MAGYNPTGDADAGFALGSIASNPQDTMQFSLDLDESGLISGASEVIYYRHNVADSELERSEGGATYETVAECISNVDFNFLDENGAPITTAANVTSVQISLEASQGGHVREMTSRVLCRNLAL